MDAADILPGEPVQRSATGLGWLALLADFAAYLATGRTAPPATGPGDGDEEREPFSDPLFALHHASPLI